MILRQPSLDIGQRNLEQLRLRFDFVGDDFVLVLVGSTGENLADASDRSNALLR